MRTFSVGAPWDTSQVACHLGIKLEGQSETWEGRREPRPAWAGFSR